MHPYFSIGGGALPSYGLMAFLGLVAASVYAYITNRKLEYPLKGDDLLHIGLFAGVGVFVGAKLLYLLTILPTLIEYWAVLMQNPDVFMEILLDGFVFYGGMLGALIFVYWYCRRYKIHFGFVAGLLAPCIPLFHTFGRIGCFLAGCCWGIEVPWGVHFEHSLGAPNGVPLLPVQLIEAFCNLLIFVVLAVCYRRFTRKWMTLPFYFILYGSVRFVLEFLRGDAVRGVWLLSTSQWISLALIAAVVILYFTKWRRPQQKAADGKSAGG